MKKMNKYFLTALLLVSLVSGAIAQNGWNRIPAFPTSCYSSQDDFDKRIRQVRDQFAGEWDKENERIRSKYENMSEAEKQKIAAQMMSQYQGKSPQELMAMQQELLDMQARMASFAASQDSMMASYNDLEKNYRDELDKQLGPLVAESKKLPDGEGTPDWAIKKGKELNDQYNQRYAAICNTYFSGPEAVMVKWLQGYQQFLVQMELPYTRMQQKAQWQQSGLPVPETNLAELDLLKKYAEKCESVFQLRKTYTGLSM